MRQYQQWDELNKYALTSKRDKETDKVAKDLYFSDTNVEKYLTKRFALWLDLRSTNDNTMHGSGRRIENASEGITIQTEKEQGADKNLNIYLFIIQDAQINFEGGRFREIKYRVSKVFTFSHKYAVRRNLGRSSLSWICLKRNIKMCSKI